MITLSILHLEDNIQDAELIRSTLQTSGIECLVNRVGTGVAFKAALSERSYDIILSDFSMPGFDGMRALRTAKEINPKTPFVFVSGTIGEDRAIESLKNGAVDYVLKDRLQRLPAALKQICDEQNRRDLRREKEAILETNDALFREITGHVDDLIAVLRFDGSSKYLSPSYQKIFGAGSDGLDFFSFIHPEDRHEVREASKQACVTFGPVVCRFRVVTENAEIMHFESHFCMAVGDRLKAKEVVVVSRNITDQVMADRASKEHSQLLSQTHDAIFVVNQQGFITYWNAGAQRLYGWASEEVIGRRANDFLASPTVQASCGSGGSSSADEWSGDLEEVTRDGKAVWVCRRGTVLRDEKGAPEAILNISFDISVQKALEEQVLRTQRTDSIGALASGITHDLNNLLAPILMAGEMLVETEDRPENARMLRLIVEGAKRGLGLLRQILQFARGEGRRNVPIDFKQIVGELSGLLGHTFPRSITFESDVPEISIKVLGDQGQVHQVLLNLCVNARDALPTSGGTISLNVREVVLKDRSFAMTSKSVSGRFIEICVSDNGCGIPEDVMPQVFEPFFTTKSGAGGTGLGLSTVLTIVRNHAGYLAVNSQVGRGTSFLIYLPACLENPDCAHPQEVAVCGNGERVLLVDGDKAILEMTRELLQAHKYEVLSAQSAAEALGILEKRQGEIHAVVADFSTPGLIDERLLKAIRTASSKTIALCISPSFATESGPAPGTGPDAFLKKPCSIGSLLDALSNSIKIGRSELDSGGLCTPGRGNA